MFEIKKIISSIITIPGIFIVYLLISGLFGFKKKINILKLNLIICFILYCISISFFSNNIIGLIEKNCSYSGNPKLDAIILLGGGVIEGVDDISGKSIPSYNMIARVVDAVRLYKKYRLPIVVSGGTFSTKVKEAVIVKRFLIDLGVKSKDIYLENCSRDTVENALFVKKVFDKKGFKKGLLVSSAYHIRRSEYLFKTIGLDVHPYSSGYLSAKRENLYIYDFLPNIDSLKDSALSLKEAIGMFFYLVKYELL